MSRAIPVYIVLLTVCFSLYVVLAVKQLGEMAWVKNYTLVVAQSSGFRQESGSLLKGGQKLENLLSIVLSELDKTFKQALKKAKTEYKYWFIAEAMTDAELFDQAIQVADGIASHINRVTVLCYIGEKAVKAKHFDKATQIASKVAEILRSKPIPFAVLSVASPSLLFYDFVEALIDAGLFEQAVQLIARSDRFEFRWGEACREVARAMIKAGLYEQFFKMVQKEEDILIRSALLQSLALELAGIGLFDKAIQIAEGIEDPLCHVGALCGIAKIAAKAGQTERAIAIFDQAFKVPVDSCKRSTVLRLIVEGMADAGLFDRALKIARSVKESYPRSELFYAVAISMANARYFDQALEIAKSVEYLCLRSDAFFAIAKAMMEIDKEKAIIALRRAIQSANAIIERSMLIDEIAQLMAKAKVKDQTIWDALVQCAKGIKRSLTDRSWALCKIAEAMADIGLFDQAIRICDIVDDSDRSLLLRDIAQKMVKAGHLNRALNIAQGIKSASKRSWMLWQIAWAAAEEEMFEQAIQIASSIVNATERSTAFWDIVRYMVKRPFNQATQIDQAIRVAQRIEDASKRSSAIRWIAENAAKSGFFSQSIEIAKSIKDVSERSLALCCIAKTMAKAGLFEQAFEIAKTAEEPVRRLQALAAIVSEMRKAAVK